MQVAAEFLILRTTPGAGRPRLHLRDVRGDVIAARCQDSTRCARAPGAPRPAAPASPGSRPAMQSPGPPRPAASQPAAEGDRQGRQQLRGSRRTPAPLSTPAAGAVDLGRSAPHASASRARGQRGGLQAHVARAALGWEDPAPFWGAPDGTLQH